MTELRRPLLEDLVREVKPGFACGEVDPNGIFQVRMNNVTKSGDIDLGKQRRVPRNHPGVAKNKLLAGDVLFNATNSPDLVGKTLFWSGLDEEAVYSNHFQRIRTDGEKLDPAYLSRWLSCQFESGIFRGLCKQWVNQATVSKESLLALRVPLPPLPEQRRIAAVLDQVDTLRAKRREAIALLDDLAQSIFLDMFGDPASCNALWDRKTIGELGVVVTGNTPSRARPENYGEGIEWIKTDNIRPPELNPSQAAEHLTVAGEKAGRVVPAESILVTCIAGSPASIGNAVLAGRRVAINQQINAFISQDPLPRFMLEQIRVGKALIQQKSTGAMTGLVNKTQFSSISLMVPPMSRQQEFVCRVECVDSQRARNVRHLAALDELFSSLQHRAFSGTLWDHEAPGEAA
ncbi:hypothetical protein JCM4814A_78200 [Streptomyces phaeofaciens JCM 4814]|uniref:Type I restriction modification DNA specificity domain-containing protein n=1 Tax=Streptomyces phaeofaciens TaxID=68254 RepID=A0A918LVP1_9ACTN|nr:restriction endonuclease subunit S [Streptomyces phaeofaciens]GGT60404.1 hypothetical protein GCM10010226_42340 [Streptomyces phaeofaciens]